MKTLTLYSRAACQLCERMIQDLLLLQQQQVFQVIVVDIDSNTTLRERYNERIPLLVADQEELCEFRLEAVAVLAYLQRHEDNY